MFSSDCFTGGTLSVELIKVILIDPQVVWEKLGITDYESNAKYRLSLTVKGVEPSDVSLLDPDMVDLKKFWTLAPHIDDSSIASIGVTRMDSRYINDFNRRIIEMSGAMGWLRLTADSSILEIGSGYGSFYEMLPHYVQSYYGLDVVPRFSKVIDSIYGIPDNIPDGVFQYAVTFNVMQHMSDNIKRNYLRGIFRIIEDGGTFVLNTGTYHAAYSTLKDIDDNAYIYTAGQLVRNLTAYEYLTMVTECAIEADVKIQLCGEQNYPGINTWFFRIKK